MQRVSPRRHRPLRWAFAYFFFLLTGYYVLRPVRDALGSTQNLQLLFTGTFVSMLVLEPLYRSASLAPAYEEPEDPEETRRGIALIALKEIDFDRATGKLSEADYEFLKAKYTAEALAALREEAGATPAAGAGPSLRCARCGAHPEPGARFCTACGAGISTAAACRSCQAPLESGSRFCTACGTKVAA